MPSPAVYITMLSGHVTAPPVIFMLSSFMTAIGPVFVNAPLSSSIGFPGTFLNT